MSLILKIAWLTPFGYVGSAVAYALLELSLKDGGDGGALFYVALVLFGLSMGCAFGSLMAHAPERFETLEEVVAYQRANAPLYTEAMLRHRAQHAVRSLPGGGFTWKYDRALRDGIREGRIRVPADLWPQWRQIECPTLLVRGSESDILTDEIAKLMLERLPHARLAVVPNAGHTVPGDQPAVFQALLREFLMP